MNLPVFEPTDSFAQMVLGKSTGAAPFTPQVYTSEDGDCIEFFIRNDDFYAERIDTFVTVYISRSTKEVIGSIIKGVNRYMREVLRRTPGFKIEIQRGRLKLGRLFTEHLWQFEESQDGNRLKYEALRDLAEANQLETELCLSCD